MDGWMHIYTPMNLSVAVRMNDGNRYGELHLERQKPAPSCVVVRFSLSIINWPDPNVIGLVRMLNKLFGLVNMLN